MATAREILQGIEAQSQELQFLDDARLETYRRQLQLIACALPGQKGDCVCGGCKQRLEIQIRPITRDSGNGHCSRSGNGHAPEMV